MLKVNQLGNVYWIIGWRREFLTVDTASKVHGGSTVKSAYTTLKGPVLRQRGLRTELLQKYLIESISEQVHAELKPKPSAHNLCSVTRADYTAQGFKPTCPAMATDRYYKTDQAITFWSENCQKIQGVTPVGTRDTPFKKNASFSTPINESLDDTTHFTLENFPKIEDI
ncbi:sperm-associated antigen 8-like isoform X2 [Brachyhypopomus gauderio]|uniref:sperm-associated antigen 8-like isoform X2 n=1 Tax=Brachyhypopomus gauderio TaxID=698409 RepID=UPI004043477F